jgi:hypothetical protein
MAPSFGALRTLVFEVPQHGKLVYCLLRDDRVPAAPKLALLGSLGVIASPIRFPAWIPVLGDLESLPLGILAMKVFVEGCPEGVVKSHRELLKRGDSHFDRELGSMLTWARAGAMGLIDGLRRRAPSATPQLVTEELPA